MERDYFMAPNEARDYGIIDEVISPRQTLPLPPLSEGSDEDF